MLCRSVTPLQLETGAARLFSKAALSSVTPVDRT